MQTIPNSVVGFSVDPSSARLTTKAQHVEVGDVPSLNSLSNDNSPAGIRGLANTKIVATIGPSCDSQERLRALLKAGVSVFRFNFSHGNHASHSEALQRLRKEALAIERPIAILQDLCGPKIRLCHVRGGTLAAELGAKLTLTSLSQQGPTTGERQGARLADSTDCDLVTTYKALLQDVQDGDRLLIDDGRVELRVLSCTEDRVTAIVERAGRISTGKGLNLPGVALSIPSITEKDWADLAWGIENQVDFVALSFVRSASDLLEVHDRLQQHGSLAKVVAKIERPEALEDIHAIVKSADGIMVARGDLGLETDFADVPLIQKRLIGLCRHYARPVITATQMLDSMVEHSKPTRAEASDVANAILDGSDAIMLSNETAAGKHPIEAVQVLGRIAQSCESDGAISGDSNWPHDLSDSAAISEAAARMATRLQAKRIVVYTQSGDTARLMARYRLPIPIVAVTATSSTYNQLALSFGVEPYLMPNIRNMDELLQSMNGLSLQQGWAEVGDPIVIVSGFDRIRGVIDTLHVHRVTPTD